MEDKTKPALFPPDQIVKSCPRIESGLRLGSEAVTACAFSIVHSPDYWAAHEVPENLTKQDLVNKRIELFQELNREGTNVSCSRCTKVQEKRYEDVSFDKLGFVDLAHYSYCNLRCDYCGFTKLDMFHKPRYEALNVLSLFSEDDVEFDASVDFNSGEPSLLKNIGEYLSFLRKNKIRTRLYSNAVKYSPEIARALGDGTVTWLIVSVDAGTSETFARTKLRDNYDEVIDNIAKYNEHCQAPEAGRVAVKYIFTRNNCAAEDITGFVSDMLRVRPHQIWLLHDFEDVNIVHTDNLDEQNHAYADMYVEFVKAGVVPSHFHETFLHQVTNNSHELLNKVKALIAIKMEDAGIRQLPSERAPDISMPLSELVDEISSRRLGRCALAPAGLASVNLLQALGDERPVSALFDISKAKTGKICEGLHVQHYCDFRPEDFDTVLVTSEYHFSSIVQELGGRDSLEDLRICLLESEAHSAL